VTIQAIAYATNRSHNVEEQTEKTHEFSHFLSFLLKYFQYWKENAFWVYRGLRHGK
jgi:hypothetical protein